MDMGATFFVVLFPLFAIGLIVAAVHQFTKGRVLSGLALICLPGVLLIFGGLFSFRQVGSSRSHNAAYQQHPHEEHYHDVEVAQRRQEISSRIAGGDSVAPPLVWGDAEPRQPTRLAPPRPMTPREVLKQRMASTTLRQTVDAAADHIEAAAEHVAEAAEHVAESADRVVEAKDRAWHAQVDTVVAEGERIVDSAVRQAEIVVDAANRSFEPAEHYESLPFSERGGFDLNIPIIGGDLPAWAESIRDGEKEFDGPHLIVYTQTHPQSSPTAAASVLHAQLRQKVSDFVDVQIRPGLGRQTVDALPAGFIETRFLDDVDRPIFIEGIVKTVAGEPVQTFSGYAKLKFDDVTRTELVRFSRHAERRQRVIGAAIVGGVVFFLLTIVYGVLKLDTATKGYWTAWLLAGGVLAILLVGGVMMSYVSLQS